VCAIVFLFLFFFSFFHSLSLSLYFRLTHSSLIASFFRLLCFILVFIFFSFHHTPQHPIFRAIRISRLRAQLPLRSLHSVRSGVFTYFSVSLSITHTRTPLFLFVIPGGVHTPRRVFTRYKRKLFNLQHSADFEDKQLEIGKRNKNSTIRQQ